MARLGYRMLRGGRWPGVQVVPAAWVARTTRVVTPAAEVARTSPFHPRLGYGLLWWVLDPAAAPSPALQRATGNAPAGSTAGARVDAWAGAYTATGAHGEYLTVLPALDIVVADKVFAPPPPARQVRKDAYLDRLLPLVIAAATR
jgi:CubicO group peptidase (beta-lactamase class C family)